jgi:hypothetical protein
MNVVAPKALEALSALSCDMIPNAGYAPRTFFK